ncbi:MAG: amidohydrolase family protein [Novosphingobium sp.]|nr:amidohydrolase family protein [Novosphingobium sp.]
MTVRFDLILRQARLEDGTLGDVGIASGLIAAMEPRLGRCDNDFPGEGRLLLPGLADHHIHLLATAARLHSVDLAGMTSAVAVIGELRTKAAMLGPGAWLRAVGYDERAGGIPDHMMLDAWLSDRPLRLQDRTGALWALNSAALALIGDPPWPEAVETDAYGHPSGRIWRGDDWLRSRIGGDPPDLAPLGRQLARCGVTSVTDAGAHNGPGEAALLAAQVRSGALPQRLTLMGREDLPEAAEYCIGPLKLLYDERDLPALDAVAARIVAARAARRAVAAHVVTEGELVFFLAALDSAGGAQPGDRIEHGSLIPANLIGEIAGRGLIVVANPGFIATRGDRYLAEIESSQRVDLHRLASLAAAGIALLGGSDAPYGPANPWTAIASAVRRKCTSGEVLGPREALDPQQALGLFRTGGAIRAGAPADCCLIDHDWRERVADTIAPDPVALTLIDGEPVYAR